MAKPRIFISSTHNDFKQLRRILQLFINDLGYESITSESGDIPYDPQIPLDESCYAETKRSDIFILIIGGRYGSPTSKYEKNAPRDFYTLYESITSEEYRKAVSDEIPIYTLIDKKVYAEYETYLRNKENTSITYAHADSVNIFRLIDEIKRRPINNATYLFEDHGDICDWLRNQWAGLFASYLSQRESSKKIDTIEEQIAQLKETASILKRYTESIMLRNTKQESKRIIEESKKHLQKFSISHYIKQRPLNLLRNYASTETTISDEELFLKFKQSNTAKTLLSDLGVNSEKIDLLTSSELWEIIESDFSKLKQRESDGFL